MTDRDPVRLLDPASGASAPLRAALQAGRSELPSEAELAAVAARLGPLLGPGGGGGEGGGPPGGGGSAGPGGAVAGAGTAKLVAGVAIAGLIAAGAMVWTTARQAPHTLAGPVAVQEATATRPPRPEPTLPVGIDPRELAPAGRATEPTARARVRAEPDAAAAPSLADPEAEIALLREAQQALRAGASGRALALATDHARLYPSGVLAQEREVVAIEALVRTGRREQALARADAFAARWPGSAHRRRLDVLLSLDR